MAVLNLKRKSGSRAPSVISGINGSHWLAQSKLNLLVPIHAQSPANSYTNLVTGERPALSNHTSAGNLAHSVRPGIGHMAAGNNTDDLYLEYTQILYPTAANTDPYYPMTLGVWFWWEDTASSDAALVAAGRTTGNGHNYLQADSVFGNQNIEAVSRGAAANAATDSGRAYNQLIFAVGVFADNADRKLYINGEEVASDATARAMSASGESMTVFGHNQIASYSSNDSIGMAFQCASALSAEQVRELYNPRSRWDIYQTTPRTISLPAAAAATSAIMMPRMRALPQRNNSGLWGTCIGAWCPSLSGTVQDLSGYGHHGTLEGTAVVVKGEGAVLDNPTTAGTDGVNTNESEFFNVGATESFSQTIWVKILAGAQLSEAPYMMGAYQASNAWLFMRIWNVSPYKIRLDIRDDSLNRSEIFDNAYTHDGMNDQRWHHVAQVFDRDAGEHRLYIDGKLMVNQSASGVTDAITPNTPLELGGSSDNRFFPGTVDDARFYKRVITSSEVSRLATRRGVAYERPTPQILRTAAATGTTVIRRKL